LAQPPRCTRGCNPAAQATARPPLLAGLAHQPLLVVEASQTASRTRGHFRAEQAAVEYMISAPSATTIAAPVLRTDAAMALEIDQICIIPRFALKSDYFISMQTVATK